MNTRKRNYNGTKVLTMVLCIFMLFTRIEVKAAEVDNVPQKGYAKVNTCLNVREDAYDESAVLEKLAPGEIVAIVQFGEDGWTKVQTDEGTVGFVSSEYLGIAFSEGDKYEILSAAVITKTDGSSENRNFNMRRAAYSVNGVTLQPGDEFAWYSTENSEGVVGCASKANGYKKAPVIVNKKSTTGYGGGVCQVSTAVYNCIYKIGIEPTEHHHHSLTSSYVEEGMDATVSYPSKNFVFTNTKDYTIMLEAYTEDSRVVVVAYKVLY
ncbi:MAG: SH3 domain-containing protein [Clostridia bacterium]|nr:SH3 domain-containing protein [Clostridia bacterium]